MTDEGVELAAAALRERGLVEPVQFTEDVGDAETVAAIALIGAGHDQLEAVVRSLAEREDTADEGDDGREVQCIYCGAAPTGIDRSGGEGYDTGYMSPPLDEHETTCLWRQARELFPDPGAPRTEEDGQ